ncbi:hypothetical protein B0H19DRAFT_1171777 [Mycena capillaripes]|nr:hypothetical protein B0H19DRAFT_1171777 [Mycena capillaripes]
MAIPNDLLCLILDLLAENRTTLCKCCLVNWEFNRAASTVLYSQVVLQVSHSAFARPRQEKFANALLSSASLPHNAPHVKVLRLGGYLDCLLETLLPAVKAFQNLQTVEIFPDANHDSLFPPVLLELENRPTLVNFRVNAACMDETNAPILVKIGGLRQLGLERPNRTVLQLLPDWLGRLSSLTEFHLTRDCGSITPGVLRSLVPFLASITAFSWGISYSVTDDDLFGFLSQLPCLQSAHLRHYLQLKVSEIGTPMKRLRSLTVCHDASEDDEVVDKLCAWVRHAISGSSIERVRFCCDEFSMDPQGPRGFDVLIEHFSRNNADTLRVLDLNGWLISASSVSLLFQTCVGLEELTTALDSDGFLEFKRLVPTTKRLHTAVLQVYRGDTDAPFSVSVEDVAQIMQSSEVLRRLSVNYQGIQGAWISQNDYVRFVVREWSDDASFSEELDISPEEPDPQTEPVHTPQAPAMDVIMEEE